MSDTDEDFDPGGLDDVCSEGCDCDECSGQPRQYHHENMQGTFVNLEDVPSTSTQKSPAQAAMVRCVLLENGLLRTVRKGKEGGNVYVKVDWLLKQRPDVFGLGDRVRKRPDRAQAAKQRKGEYERVVKCGLAGHLLQSSLKEALRARVRSVSEATNRAGLMLLDIVMRCQDTNVELPLMDQTFFYRLLTASETEPTIRSSIEDTFSTFPALARHGGDSQIISIAAKAMKTNFMNSIVYAFEARQKRYISSWCKQDPERRGKPFGIIKAINNWGIMEDLTPDARRFVDAERDHMENPSMITKSWLSGHVSIVLRQYRRWLSILEANGDKLFTITPIWDIRSHFIKLDTDAFYLLMTAERLFRGSEEAFRSQIDDHFGSVFKLSGLATNKWHFSRTVDTDGVSLCVHFKRDKSAAEIKSDEEKKNAVTRSKLEMAARREARERSPERVKKERDAARLEKKTATQAAKKAAKQEATKAAKEAMEPSSTEAVKQVLPEVRDGDLTQDPGLSPNVTYTVHIVKGKKVRKRFTIGRYHKEGGIKKQMERTALWLKEIQAAQATLDEISLKTSTHAFVRAHVRRYASVHKAIWDEKTKLRWSRGKLDIYIRKPASIDAFFKGIKKDGPVKRHFYGDASIRSGIPGTKSAPNSLCLRRAKMAFEDTTIVDEYLTTQCCWKCLSRTRPVRSIVDGVPRKVRGLVFCDSRTCGCLTNRDFQGAMNIMACGIGPRPAQLARTPVIGTRRTEVFTVKSPGKQCVLRRPPKATPYRNLLVRGVP